MRLAEVAHIHIGYCKITTCYRARPDKRAQRCSVSSIYIYNYIYLLLLLLLLLIIEHTTEGAGYYLVWGGDVEWGMNGRGGGGGG